MTFHARILQIVGKLAQTCFFGLVGLAMAFVFAYVFECLPLLQAAWSVVGTIVLRLLGLVISAAAAMVIVDSVQ
jgi:hypothetical protein